MRLSQLIADNPHLDHDVEIQDGDIPTDLISLSRVVRLTDTDDALLIGSSDMGGIVQYGIVRSACLQVEAWMVGGE